MKNWVSATLAELDSDVLVLSFALNVSRLWMWRLKLQFIFRCIHRDITFAQEADTFPTSALRPVPRGGDVGLPAAVETWRRWSSPHAAEI